MSPRSGLVGAVVQRSLADWPVVLAALLLLVCSTTLLATGVVYGDAVATGGLHRAILAAPPTDRTLLATLSATPGDAEAIDATIRSGMDRAMAASGGDVFRVLKSDPFADAATPASQVHDLTEVDSVDGLQGHVTLVGGGWPLAGGSPIQATISDAAAAAMHLKVGDQLNLVSRLDTSNRIQVGIVGIWHLDAADPLFAGDDLQATGETSGSGLYTTRGPLVVDEADLAAIAGDRRVEADWRGVPDIASLRIDAVDDLRTGADGLADQLRGVLPVSAAPRVSTGLPDLLAQVGRSVLVSRSGILLLTIQFAILAGYSILLVAGLLLERRRSEIALMRSRGASGGHLVTMALVEAGFLAVPAAIVAPFLAVGLVNVLGTVGPAQDLELAGNAAISQTAIVVSIVAGLACIVALTLPTVFVSASPAGARASEGRQGRTTLPQRLGLDLALVAIAAIAIWQLHLYGAPLTVNARGTLGLDPLLVAAPAIGLLAGAVLALRVLPRVAELGEWMLVRGRGLVGSLGGRQLARRPLRYTRAALLLILASALGTLAAADAATWTRSQADQAAYQAAADIRATTSDYSSLPTWASGPLDRAIPGVVAAAPVLRTTFDIGRTIRDADLIGLDAASLATVFPDGTGTATAGGAQPVAASAAVSAAPSATAGSSAERGSAAPASSATAAAVATVSVGAPSTPTAVFAPVVAATTPSVAVALPGTPSRLALTLDAAFRGTTAKGSDPLPDGTPGLTARLVLRDGDGRLFRTADVKGSLAKPGQRLVFDLADPTVAGVRPTMPLSLEAVEVDVLPETAEQGVFGQMELTKLEATDDTTGDAGWRQARLDAGAAGWSWDRIDGNQVAAFSTTSDHPARVVLGATDVIFGGFGSGTSFRLRAAAPSAIAAAAGSPADSGTGPVIPIVASDAFMSATGASVGQELQLTNNGLPIVGRIVGTVGLFAPLDPAKPFVLADLSSLDTLRYLSAGQIQPADEWWLRVQPGAEPAVLAALRDKSAGTSAVIGRAELQHELSSDPVPLGLIGILGLGSIAAMLFAGIGFLVSSTVSTSERMGEFALLRALGLSNAQLSAWLSIESVFLLVAGLAIGSLLGLLLAWLVLPVATLTQTGLAPVPAPVVIIPWEQIVPIYLFAILLFLVSLVLVRRQLPDVRISSVLRARES